MTKNQKALKVFLILLNRYEILCDKSKDGTISLKTPFWGCGYGRSFYDAVTSLVYNLDDIDSNTREEIRKIING